MSNEPIEYVKHIADECSYIISVTSNLSKKLIFRTRQRAVVRSLEVIGKATKKIPADFKVK